MVPSYAKNPSQNKIPKYGVMWHKTISPVSIELDCIRMGGRWLKKSGGYAGEGLHYHYKQFISLVWPWIKWHDWAERQLKCYLDYRIIGQIGPASTGKSFIPAACVLTDYYAWPECTTVMVSSTTRESLEMRVWGEIKKLHKDARINFSWLPGSLIEGKQRIVTDPRSESSEGRDFRNGIVGVPCKKGQSFQGMEEYVGIKNKRLRLLADELQFLPRQFIDAISNLNKNPDFKCVGSGNPKETTDALGVLCEPAAHLGGWDGGIDQMPQTKTWDIRFAKGICLQLVGTDSPNLDGKMGIPLITQEQIDADIAFYGKDSVQFSMMDMGMMPRGQGSHRVLTRQMCLKFQALEEPIWKDSNRVRIGFLDAAYRGTGGDRCVFGEMQYGEEQMAADGSTVISNLIMQRSDVSRNRQLLALIDHIVVPISNKADDLPEDQIVNFVKEQCQQRGIPPSNFFFDCGMKASLASAFTRLWSNEVVPIDFGGEPSEKQVSNEINMPCRKYYSKYVTELWYSVRHVVESRQFRGMTEDAMMEFCAREWMHVSGNRIEVEAKEKTKVKTGRSPDLADAVAIGVEGARRLGFKIAKLGSPQMKRQDNRWKTDLKKKADDLWRSKELTYT